MKLACVVGVRPNFMKMAPVLRALAAYPSIHPVLIHSGQHYDTNLSDVFFADLGIKRPDIFLGVGSGTHAEQTAQMLVALEREFVSARDAGLPFDRLLVVGDVNSTMAATLAAAKLHIPVAHVEAGLRSGDRTMPEEVNRIVTDSLADLFLVSEPAGVENLINEGHSPAQIHLVGNVMIDTLNHEVVAAKQRTIISDFGLSPGRYGVVTLHRPANVDNADVLQELVEVLIEVSKQIKFVFPVHPRTKVKLQAFGLWEQLAQQPQIRLCDALGYLDFLSLTSRAKVIVTDSGGLQEESTALGVPCLTMRDTTERPITVSEGSSTLCGSSAELLKDNLRAVFEGTYKRSQCPKLWDGRAAERIAAILARSSGRTEPASKSKSVAISL